MPRLSHSASSADPEPRLAFGEFELDPSAETLRRRDEIVQLRPKTWAVLRLLAERAGRLVTNRELLDAVWADTAVTPNVLTNVIGELRVALGDRAQPARFVQTVHRRGYRFVAEIRRTVPPPPPRTRVEQTSSLDGTSAEADLFVGREAELDALRDEWARVTAGERRLAFVAGVPGIGKSTLVDAFVARVLRDAHGASPMIARVQCIERRGTADPYLPLLDALEQIGAGPRRSVLRAALRRHAPAWLAHLPWLASPAELESLQRSLTGSGEARMAREGSRLLEALAARRPLVLIVEDLHWSDPPTLDVLTTLAARPGAARLLVIGTYRPIDAVVEGHPVASLVRELRQRGQATELPLAPFAMDELGTFLERRFASRDVAQRLAPRLEEQSGGNPLFVSALVAHLVAQGALRRRGAAWEVHAETDAGDVGLPSDLREAIERQWTDLRPEARAVLEAASVDGVEFDVDAVAAGLAATTDEVEDVCHGLANAGRLVHVVEARSRRTAGRSVRYRFPHALHRRVLYDRLAPSRRREIHRRIGEHLERTSTGAEDAARLLVHFEAAGDDVRTTRWVEQVGWNAMARHAYGVAAQCFATAIEHLQRAPRGNAPDAHEAMLQLVLGNAQLMTHGYADARVHDAFAASERRARSAGLHDLRFRALIGLGTVAIAAGDPLRAEPHVAQMAAMVAGEAPQFAAQALWRAGDVYLQKGELAAARAALERAAVTEAAPGVPFGTDLQVDIHGLLGLTLWQLGLFDDARAAFARSLRRADEVELPFSYGQARVLAAEGCVLREEPDELLVRLAEVVGWMERYAFPSARAMEGFYRHWARHRKDPAHEHARGMHDAVRAKNALGEHWRDSVHLAAIAAAYLDCAAFDAARECLATALAHATRTGERCHEAELHRLDGELRLAEAGSARRCVAAEESFERAITVARAQGALAWELRATTGLARALARRGAGRSGSERLARVVDALAAGGDAPDLRVARALLVRLR